MTIADQVAAVLAELPEPEGIVFVCIAKTGVRISEVLGAK